jgi:hypothetical protein
LTGIVGHTLWIEQLKAIGVTLALSLIGTTILGYVLKATIGLRPSLEDEETGLDVSGHGASAAMLTGVPSWHQARAIVQGVRVGNEHARVMLVDSSYRVIAASDDAGLLSERVQIARTGRQSGHYKTPQGDTVAFHATPGYETYKGLGWRGVIVQNPR